jgi:hypothetical protein
MIGQKRLHVAELIIRDELVERLLGVGVFARLEVGGPLRHLLIERRNFSARGALGVTGLAVLWSGSGWHLGAPKKLTSTPLLGFPTYDVANMFTLGLTARF